MADWLFQTASRKTISKDGCRKIAAMHITLKAGVKTLDFLSMQILMLIQTERLA